MAKTIFIVTERFYPEEFRINDLALEWVKRGYKVYVLTQFPSYPFGKIFPGYKNKFYQKEIWQGIEIHRILSVTGYKESLFKKILQYLNYMILGSFFVVFLGQKCDVIFKSQQGPITDAIPAIVAKKLYKKKLTMWITDIWPDSFYAYGFKKTRFTEVILGFLIKFIYRNCDNILVSSPGFIERVKNFTSKKEIYYSPCWADESLKLSINKKQEKNTEKKIHFTFAGNIGKVQNLENLILGFAASDQIDRMQLDIIGDGSHKGFLEELVKKNKIKNVVFYGRKRASEMAPFYEMSDVLIIPLKRDPFLELTLPGKFQTCLTIGKPIFAVMFGEVKRMVDENELGLSADPESVEDIKISFEKFANLSKEKLEEYGSNCTEFYKREFNKKVLIDNITEKLFNCI